MDVLNIEIGRRFTYNINHITRGVFMKNVKIDLLREKYNLEEEDDKSPFLFFGRLLVAFVIFTAIGGAAFSYGTLSNSAQDNPNFPELNLFTTIKNFVSADEKKLEGQEQDRINVLLMGIGGSGHSGPQLTDTMIFASYKPSTGEVGMISIPRDLNVPIEGHGWRKINHANAFGEMEEPGTGPELATDVVETVLEQKIHYFVRVDFDGFAKLIDTLGGIDVHVDRSFTDYQYPSHGKEFADCGQTRTVVVEGEEVEKPDYSCRYETISFEKGWAHMDGDTTLKYVRSRHGTNGESSDFARSRRQQNVLMAVKDKVFSTSTLLDISRMKDIRDTLEEHVATNFETWELLRLAKQAKDQKITRDKLVSHVLDAGSDSPLYATIVNGAYVLLPENDDWSPVQRLAQNIFDKNAMTTIKQEPPKTEQENLVNIEVQNGTRITGLAGRTSDKLDERGYNVVKIGNAAKRGYQKTVVYDLTDGKNPEALTNIRDYLNAEVTISAGGWLASGQVIPENISLNNDEYRQLATEDDVDFLIILGEETEQIVKRN